MHYLNKRNVLLTIWHTSFFEQKVNSFIKILSKRLLLILQFRNPQNLDEKTNFFTIHAKTTSNSQRNKEKIKSALHRLLGGIIRGTRFSYKQPSCYGSNVKSGLNVKQLVKQPPTLKTLMQKSLVGLWVKNLTFSFLSSLKLNLSTTLFGTT